MNYRIVALSVFLGIAIGSFCIGQGKPTAKSQAASDAKMPDHDKIEKLQSEVAELQQKLAELTQKYEAHTHQLRNVGVAQIPGLVECDQTVVQWAATGIRHEPVQRVCRQRMPGDMNVLVSGKELAITGPPNP